MRSEKSCTKMLGRLMTLTNQIVSKGHDLDHFPELQTAALAIAWFLGDDFEGEKLMKRVADEFTQQSAKLGGYTPFFGGSNHE